MYNANPTYDVMQHFKLDIPMLAEPYDTDFRYELYMIYLPLDCHDY